MKRSINFFLCWMLFKDSYIKLKLYVTLFVENNSELGWMLLSKQFTCIVVYVHPNAYLRLVHCYLTIQISIFPPLSVSSPVFLDKTFISINHIHKLSKTYIRCFKRVYKVFPKPYSCPSREIILHLDRRDISIHYLWALRLLGIYSTKEACAIANECIGNTIREISRSVGWKKADTIVVIPLSYSIHISFF